MNKKSYYILIAIILTMGILAGCAKVPVETEEVAKTEEVVKTDETEAIAESTGPIKIGWVAEMTGSWGFVGSTGVNGAQLAVDEINATGGVLGRQLELIVEDSKSDPATAIALVTRLDTDENVLVVSGPTMGDTSLAIHGYAEENQLPYAVPVAATPRLTEPGSKYTFRMEPDATGWGYAYASYIAKVKPGAKVAVMYMDLATQASIAAGFVYTAEKFGLEVVADVPFPADTTDATVEIAQVKAKNPDYVMTGGAGGFWIGLKTQLLDGGFSPEQIIDWIGPANIILSGGPRLVGSYIGTFFDFNFAADNPGIKTFVEKYQAYKGTIPGYIENFSYCTIYLIKEAIELAGTADNREAFRNALSAIDTVEFTTGIPIKFDESGARTEYLYIVQIKDVQEKTYTVEVVDYVTWDATTLPVYELSR